MSVSNSPGATVRAAHSGNAIWHDAQPGAAQSRLRELRQAAQRPPLIMRCGAFGDMVLLTVLIRQLYARFGKRVDVISSGPWTRPLLENDPAVGALFILRSRRTPYWLSFQQQRLVAWLRQRGPSPTWFCDRGPGRELLTLGGIPEDYVCDSRSFAWVGGESYADRYLRLGNVTPVAFDGQLPPAHEGAARTATLTITPAARLEFSRWRWQKGLAGRPFVVIHPGSRQFQRRGLRPRVGASKYWPVERWAEVVRAIRAARPEHAIVLSGTRAEYRLNAEIVRRAQASDVTNAAGALSVPMLLPLLEAADSLISVDTGPAHAAAALGCPTVALFGTADPHLYRPGGALTPAVALTGTVAGQPNILGITVESVITGWLELTASSRSDSLVRDAGTEPSPAETRIGSPEAIS